MSQNQRYDVVVVGGGCNGLGIAAYLAKCGVKACLCEARREVGGGCETIEPMPGFRIEPHAAYNFAGAAPGWEQLELWKYGLRVVPHQVFGAAVSQDCEKVGVGGRWGREAMREAAKMGGEDAAVQAEATLQMLDSPECKEFLRSIFWTPPPPEGYNPDPKDLPWVKTVKRLPLLGLVYDDSWLAMSVLDIANILCQEDSQKAGICMASWAAGPDFISKGMGIVGFAESLLVMYASGGFLGGMHSYMHALARCAIAHGATILTNSAVEEIIVENGEAKGVRLVDTAPPANKVIFADKAVISGTHVKETFLKLVGARHLDRGFLQRVKDTNLNGGSLMKLDLIVKELPHFRGKAGEFMRKYVPSTVCWPADRLDMLINQRNAVYVERRHPLKRDEMIIQNLTQSVYDPTRCPPGYHTIYNVIPMPPPEYHRDGPDAANKARDEIVDAMLQHYREYCTNMGDDNIVAKFVMTPYDSAFRNMGMVSGNFQGIRSCEDQWWINRPLPELSRYRTPIDRLYLCNQTSHPGGLAIMAVPYCLMHILIEDLNLKPGGWWYPAPYYVSDREVKSGEV
jgi:beta-carotene ketolase (CrtO type)